MDQLHAAEAVKRSEVFEKLSKKSLDMVISKIKEESFKGLIYSD